MEEQRIGVMYWNMVKRRTRRWWDNLFPKGLRRSSALPILVIGAVIVVPLVGWTLHMHGKLGSIRREINHEVPAEPARGPLPGEMEPIFLSRAQTPGSNMPEFGKVTLLPGLGMDVLQIVAFLPTRGEVPLLASPTVEAVANMSAPAKAGESDRWGSLEVPWSGLLTGLLEPTGNSFRTNWKGHTIEAPTDTQGRGVSHGGELAGIAVDSSQTAQAGDQTTATAVFRNTDFDQRWPSKNDVSVVATLGPRTLDLTVTVKNVGDQPEPMGIGWHPRFLIPSGNRGAAELHLPGGEEMEIADRVKGVPSGHMMAPSPELSRFQNHPTALGSEPLDTTLVDLKASLLDTGAAAELRDPSSEFGLRMIAVSPSIRALDVSAPAGTNLVAIGMQTNLDDPLGKEWGAAAEPPIATLQPGQSLQWKIRLEIFSISDHSGSSR